MQKDIKKTEAKQRRIVRVRAKISGTAERPRLAVRRTLKHIYAQLIDDRAGKTLVAASDSDIKDAKLKKTEVAAAVGKLLSEKAKAKKIEAAVFDRRDKKFHGRVKALAEGAREAGLKF
jgi:large subunit ribosomal protein L18